MFQKWMWMHGCNLWMVPLRMLYIYVTSFSLFAALRAGGDPGVPAGLLQHEDLLRRPREGAQAQTHSRQRSILGIGGPDAGGGATGREESSGE